MGGCRLLCVTFFLGWACMTLGQGGDDTTLPCVKQLLPCRPFIGATAPPTPMCCDPLRQMMKNEVECLCVFFNNAEIMKSLNVTKDQALQLPEACGEEANLSLCKTANNGTSSPGPTSTAVGEQENPAPSSQGSGLHKKKGYLIVGAVLAAVWWSLVTIAL